MVCDGLRWTGIGMSISTGIKDVPDAVPYRMRHVPTCKRPCSDELLEGFARGTGCVRLVAAGVLCVTGARVFP